jgi:hypothetical protein
MDNPADNPYRQPEHTQPGPREPDPRDSVFFKRNQLREVAWRITAVVLVVKAMLLLVQVFAYAQNLPLRYVAWLILPLGVLLVMAFAAYSASRAWTDAVQATEPIPVDGGVLMLLQRVAFSIVGVVLVADALPALATNALTLMRPGTMLLDYVAGLSGSILQFTMGIALFFGSDGLSRLWTRFRSFGHSRP